VKAGRRVAVIGAGGIGFDVAEYLLHEDAGDESPEAAIDRFQREWGVDPAPGSTGGLRAAAAAAPHREVTLLQRKPEKPGRRLGVSTGWALKLGLARERVRMLSGCRYERIDDAGLHVSVAGEPQTLAVDHVIVCAGQESERSLHDELRARGIAADLIGGADVAEELDALRAIDQGTRLAWSF
jgi:2,4-dienoyl-CoA reductase (NADPH2)